MNPHPKHPDARIDHVLNALRTTQPTPGLEERVAARLTQANEARLLTAAPSFFAVILNAVKNPRILFSETTPYTFAATALILVLAIVSISARNHQAASTQPALLAQASATANIVQPLPYSIDSPQTSSKATTQIRFKSPIPAKSAGVSIPVPTDPDALALAETLAPSRPTPTLPLTQQERLMLSATRPGQPIEIAELEPFREPALRSAAEAHEHATLRKYIQGLLAPLASAQALNPTPLSPLQDEVQPAAASESPSSK